MIIPDWYGERQRRVEFVSETAIWYHSGQPPLPIRWVLIRDPAKRGKFKTQALLCTDLAIGPAQIIKWFVLRWRLEVTFHEAREHLGMETQRQGSDLATLAPRAGRVRVLRTTPALLALFSLVTLLAHQHAWRRKLPIRQAAWYHKSQPTFSDALALVRRHAARGSRRVFQLSLRRSPIQKCRRRFKIGCFQPCVTRPEGLKRIKSSSVTNNKMTNNFSRSAELLAMLYASDEGEI